jgi:hypothetical protein
MRICCSCLNSLLMCDCYGDEEEEQKLQAIFDRTIALIRGEVGNMPDDDSLVSLLTTCNTHLSNTTKDNDIIDEKKCSPNGVTTDAIVSDTKTSATDQEEVYDNEADITEDDGEDSGDEEDSGDDEEDEEEEKTVNIKINNNVEWANAFCTTSPVMSDNPNEFADITGPAQGERVDLELNMSNSFWFNGIATLTMPVVLPWRFPLTMAYLTTST